MTGIITSEATDKRLFFVSLRKNFFLSFCLGQHIANGGGQLLHVERFGEKADGEGEGGDEVGPATDEEDGDFGVLAAGALGDGHAVGAGHVQIGDDEVDMVRIMDQAAGFVAVRGLEHFEASIGEDVHHNHADQAVVLGDENSAWVCHMRGPFLSDQRGAEEIVQGFAGIVIRGIAVSKESPEPFASASNDGIDIS